MNESFLHHTSPYLAHAILAFFGAIVHASKTVRDGRAKGDTPTQILLDFTILVIMSSFSGVMFALLGFEMFGIDSYLSMAMAGVGGYVGVEGMTFVVNYLTEKWKK